MPVRTAGRVGGGGPGRWGRWAGAGSVGAVGRVGRLGVVDVHISRKGVCIVAVKNALRAVA